MEFPLPSRIRLALTTFGLVAFGSQILFGATLTGRIYSDQGPPVTGTLVTVQPTVAASSGLTTYQAVTDGQGKFVVTVPAGAIYSVCAGNPLAGLLNSCEWSLAQSQVRIPEQATSAEAIVTLQTGIPLPFRVSDPAGVLPRPGTVAAPASVSTSAPAGATGVAATSAASAPLLSFGLWDSSGHYHFVPMISGDDQGVNFWILVPPNASFTLSITGSNIQVADKTGASALNSTQSVSSNPSSLAQTPVFQAAAAAAAAPVSTTPSTTQTTVAP